MINAAPTANRGPCLSEKRPTIGAPAAPAGERDLAHVGHIEQAGGLAAMVVGRRFEQKHEGRPERAKAAEERGAQESRFAKLRVDANQVHG